MHLSPRTSYLLRKGHKANLLKKSPLSADGDTIINYTQRRILWSTDWLVSEMNADPERVFIQGHSVGSAGTTALAKAFPNRFAIASIFNNGFDGPQDSGGETILGTAEQNLPTNLRNFQGEVVHINDLYNLSTPIATMRDLPIMRSWQWDVFLPVEDR